MINPRVRTMILKSSRLKIQSVPLSNTPIQRSSKSAVKKEKILKFLQSSKFDVSEKIPSSRSRHGSGTKFSIFKSLHQQRRGSFHHHYSPKHTSLRMQIHKHHIKSAGKISRLDSTGDSISSESGSQSSQSASPSRPDNLSANSISPLCGLKKNRRKSTSAAIVNVVSPLGNIIFKKFTWY